MWRNLDFNIHNTFLSFKRYVFTFSEHSKIQFSVIEKGYWHVSTERYLAFRELMLADARFFSVLTKDELKELQSMDDDYDLKKYDSPLLRSAFNKWSKIFFPIYKRSECINKFKLGILMNMIRKDEMMTIKELSKRMQVSTRTIHRIENGEVLPTIDYLFLFCKMFDSPMEKLLKLCNLD